MDEKDISRLIEKYKNGTLTTEESDFLDAWYINYASDKASSFKPEDLDTNMNLLWKDISSDLSTKRFRPNHLSTKKVKLWPRIAVAASFLIISGLTLYFLNASNNTFKAGQTVLTAASNITPGSNKAFLTLADGSRISLNDAANGELVKQAGMTITKTANGELIYTVAAHASTNAANAYNTIETPKGGQYQVNLPDGSRVWLNAATKLRFPIAFTKKSKERKVELEGEAYFEISHNANMPFRVKTRKQQVEVLGTHFNVSSYPDDTNTKTTLLEGSVRVKSLLTEGKGKESFLKPGQQSSLSTNAFEIKNVDIEEAVAWKNGQFMFNNAALKDVMKEISRWYNVEVIYKGNFDHIELGGSISKFTNITEVLDVVELAGKVKIKIEGNTVVVNKLPE